MEPDHLRVHFQSSPQTGTRQVAGYFASNAGIDKAFLGAPSEATPSFTYRSEPLSLIIRIRIFLNARRSWREIRSSSRPQDAPNDHFSGLA